MQEYDIIIVGSGIGGLVCGNILSLEGLRVCVLEKNRQIGGCLQIYVRDKVIFDSGVHYLGGLEKGQNLHQLFKYLGIVDKLRLERMDEDGFDHILVGGDPKPYRLAQGYPRFIASLTRDFPEEEVAINTYCAKMRELCSQFPLYHLQRGGTLDQKTTAMRISAQNYIESLTTNKQLQAVLGGNNILYAGYRRETPFHVHALVLNSYIESAWRCLGGGATIAHFLAGNIRRLGGAVRSRAEVRAFRVQEGRVYHVELADGSKLCAKAFISNLAPAKTFELTQTDLIRKAYRGRIRALKQTVSVFILNLVLKDGVVPYEKHNYYFHKEGHSWDMADYNEENWPLGYAVYLSPSSAGPGFAAGMTIFTYMRFEEMAPWQNTENTVTRQQDRGPDYAAFKRRKAEILLDAVGLRFSDLRSKIKSYNTATPLSFRDYIGSDDGSLYGIAKDFRDPFKTLIPARTKLPNLFLTGQNLHIHGILGASLSGLVTAAAYLGNDAFIEKISNA